MEDFSLSPEIVLHCRTEIEAHCSGLHRKGRTLHCLMRIGRGDRSTTVDGVCQSAVRPPQLLSLCIYINIVIYVNYSIYYVSKLSYKSGSSVYHTSQTGGNRVCVSGGLIGYPSINKIER